MLKAIKRKLMILGAVVSLAMPLAVPAFANAQVNLQNDVGSNGCTGSGFTVTGGTGSGDCSSSTAGSSINTLLKNIIDVFSVIVGLVAVIMIIVGGFRY